MCDRINPELPARMIREMAEMVPRMAAAKYGHWRGATTAATMGEKMIVEYRPNKRRFPQVGRVSPGHQTVVNLRFDAVLA